MRNQIQITQTWTASDDFAEVWLAENIGLAKVIYSHPQNLPAPPKIDSINHSAIASEALSSPQPSASPVFSIPQLSASQSPGIDTVPLSAPSPPPAPIQPPAPQVIDIESTTEHRHNRLRLCAADIGRYYCRDPYYCMKHQNLHVCVDYAGNGCSHGGPGIVHLGSIHTSCRGRGSRDCKQPGCFMPTGINVLHTKYSCYTYRHDTVNPVCPRGGAEGGCPYAHDNEDIRCILASSWNHRPRGVPAA